MSRDLITVTPETSVLDAGRLMVDNTIRRLPVTSGGRLVGIVTHGDVRGAKGTTAAGIDLWELNYQIARLTVGDVMTPDPVTVTPDDTIGRAAQLMLNHMVSGLPVVDHHVELVGIITESDIFRMVVHDWQRNQPDPTEPYARYD